MVSYTFVIHIMEFFTHTYSKVNSLRHTHLSIEHFPHILAFQRSCTDTHTHIMVLAGTPGLPGSLGTTGLKQRSLQTTSSRQLDHKERKRVREREREGGRREGGRTPSTTTVPNVPSSINYSFLLCPPNCFFSRGLDYCRSDSYLFQ